MVLVACSECSKQISSAVAQGQSEDALADQVADVVIDPGVVTVIGEACSRTLAASLRLLARSPVGRGPHPPSNPIPPRDVEALETGTSARTG